MPGKVCDRCGLEKDFNLFRENKDKRRSHNKVHKYYKNICLECEKQYQRECKQKKKKERQEARQKYELDHFDEIQKRRQELEKQQKEYSKIYQQEYREKYKDYLKEQKQKYYTENKNIFFTKNKKYREENKVYLSEKAKEYRTKNKDQIRKRANIYQKKRYHSDVNYRLRQRLSHIIRVAIENNGGQKDKSISAYLPYDIPTLRKYIENLFESWMNWSNYGIYNSKTWDDKDPSTWTWHIDHIIPQSALPYDSMSHPNFKKCWALANLRPYSAKQNVLEGARKARQGHANNFQSKHVIIEHTIDNI